MAQKILLIEDEDGIVHLINLYLKNEGFTVVIAKDGADGLALHAREKPDLVILDIMLPAIDGFSQSREYSQRALEFFGRLILQTRQ